ncbi:MAG: hypothetical protein HY270_10535 [Deltaproteobacteria bacterium]|nr:hypothetical protein [Deltaproteobacteria bacterium]
MRRYRIGLGVLFFVVLGTLCLTSCGNDDDRAASTTPSVLVFNAENNRLDAYDPNDNFRKQVVDHNHSEDPNGRDINGQICFLHDGSRRFIAGEDTGQPNPPQGWGLFQLHGTRIGELSLTQIGKLSPTYQSSPDNAENYGCGFLKDGRLLTTDVGDQASGPGNGQLVVWFPPFDSATPRYCKLDITIGTAGGILVDSQDRIYVASARVTPGIYRYTGPFPTSDTAAGGCGKTDSSGAPLADSVTKELFIPMDGHIRTPNAIVQSQSGTFYVSSVFNGVIAEYDAQGKFKRNILQPVSGQSLPYPSTGTPLGLGLDSAGNLYYADIGIVQNGLDIGPGSRTGTVRRIRFVSGTLQAPDTMDTNLDFPDGIGILE